MNAAETTRALGGRWYGSYGSACCPAHEDHNPSLSLRDGDDDRVLVKCHAGCAYEDIIDALRSRGLWRDRRAAAPSPMPRPKPAAEPFEGPGETTRVARALRIWAEARDPRGTMVERYLASRGLELPEDVACRALRYHPALRHPAGGTWPGMVALFRDLRTDEPRGLHRTFLARDGGGKAPVDGDTQKMMLGPVAGAAIKITPDDEVTYGLVVGEGIETCLAARALGIRPVWALGSAGAIGSLPVLPGIEGLTLLGETDRSGANARECERCARRWLATGQATVERLEPIGPGDANDVLLRQMIRHG